MWTLESLHAHINSTLAKINDRWVPARPIPYRTFPQRLREAWAVFTGKADCFTWPEGQ